MKNQKLYLSTDAPDDSANLHWFCEPRELGHIHQAPVHTGEEKPQRLPNQSDVLRLPLIHQLQTRAETLERRP